MVRRLCGVSLRNDQTLVPFFNNQSYGSFTDLRSLQVEMVKELKASFKSMLLNP